MGSQTSLMLWNQRKRSNCLIYNSYCRGTEEGKKEKKNKIIKEWLTDTKEGLAAMLGAMLEPSAGSALPLVPGGRRWPPAQRGPGATGDPREEQARPAAGRHRQPCSSLSENRPSLAAGKCCGASFSTGCQDRNEKGIRVRAGRRAALLPCRVPRVFLTQTTTASEGNHFPPQKTDQIK